MSTVITRSASRTRASCRLCGFTCHQKYPPEMKQRFQQPVGGAAVGVGGAGEGGEGGGGGRGGGGGGRGERERKSKVEKLEEEWER